MLVENSPQNLLKASDVLEKFANAVTEEIIGSAMAASGQKAGLSGRAQPWGTLAENLVEDLAEDLVVDLAEDLASAVVEAALMEACGAEGGFQRSGWERDDPTQILDESQRFPLSQLGLPTVGSLDYPDAPPTTPLLRELEASRSSFARKLKGGLAKVFLPSPPPPTPKDGEHKHASTDLDPQEALMEHLMHSLTSWAPYEEGPHGGAKMEALAEALSSDILDQVLRAHQLPTIAHRLAENILVSSLEEARMLV